MSAPLRLGLAGLLADQAPALQTALINFAGPIELAWSLASSPAELAKLAAPRLWLLTRQDPQQAAFRQHLLNQGAALSLVDASDPAIGWPESLDALSPHLRALAPPASGLFSRLSQRNAQHAAWRWTCDNCDDPDCEHRLKR